MNELLSFPAILSFNSMVIYQSNFYFNLPVKAAPFVLKTPYRILFENYGRSNFGST
jgi:hypothetical protein